MYFRWYLAAVLLYPAVTGSSDASVAKHSTSRSKAQHLLRAEVSGNLKVHRVEKDHVVAKNVSSGGRPMIVMIMFDHRYLGVWECWRDHWVQSSAKSGHHLEVVVYDAIAEEKVAEWKEDHPDLKFKLHRVLSDDDGDPDSVGSMLNSSRFKDLFSSADEGSLERRWDSAVYEANFWRQIRKRLDEGKDVLHVDVDAIPVGNLWTPVERILQNLTDVDMVTPGASNEIQYIMFRNTPAASEVVDYHLREWDDYLKKILTANEKTQTELVRPSEPQMALMAYQGKYKCTMKPLEQDLNHTYFVGHRDCTTHTNRNLRIAFSSGIAQNACCQMDAKVFAYQNEVDKRFANNPLCKDIGVFVDHGRNFLNSHCPLTKYDYKFPDVGYPKPLSSS